MNNTKLSDIYYEEKKVLYSPILTIGFLCHYFCNSSCNFVQYVECRTYAHNSLAFTHYLVLSRHFWLTRVYLKANKDHFVMWHAFSNCWGRQIWFPLFHPRQQRRLLEGICCSHLVQLSQGESLLYFLYNQVPSTWTMNLQY